MVRKSILASATLIGTIIGAGIFGIPYIISKSGFIIGLTHIIIIAIISLITMLYLGEIALRTKANLHLTGYAEKYLNKKGKILMLIALGFGIYAAITAYLIGIGESLSYLFFSSPDFTIHLGIIFWILTSLICYKGIKALQNGEFFGVIIILILLISMSLFFINKIDLSNLANNMPEGILSYFVPFGVIIFAFLGYATIPEVENILKGKTKYMKSTIIFSIILCTIIYIVFAIIVIGLKGKATPEIATIALGKPFILLGIFTMFTSYLTVSVALIDMLNLDFKLRKRNAWLLCISIPIILFIILTFTNTASFTKVLGIGGVISGGITSILILLMIKKAKYLGDRNPEYSIPVSNILTYLLIIIYCIGTIAEIINSL